MLLLVRRPSSYALLYRCLSSSGGGIPYANITVSAPRETFEGERRVALSPAVVQALVKKGFKVQVESGAGIGANWSDAEFTKFGAVIGDKESVLNADIILKVRPPLAEDLPAYRDGSTLISFIHPAVNKEIVNQLATKDMTVFAMDCVPRISRAQVFDALSSMANIAGYRAVVEAANHFGRFFTGQITAAGKVPPAKVLVIGGGVAGLSAIGTARGMMTDSEKHARFGAEECPRKLERSRVLTMKYGKHQMVMIRKRMQVESWIEEQINKLFNGSEDHEVFIDLDTFLDMPSVTDKRKFVFGQLQHGFCPASMDKITMFLDELMERVQGL